MKKFFLTILFTLVLSGVAFASIIELNRCVMGQNNYPEFKKADWKSLDYNNRNTVYYKFLDKPKKNNFDEWILTDERAGAELLNMDQETLKELTNDGYKKLTFSEKHLYSINTNNSKVTFLRSYTDEYWDYQQEYIYKWKKLEPNKNRTETVKAMYDFYSRYKKTKIEKYNIVEFFDNKIIAERDDQARFYPDERWSILIDLEKSTVTFNQKGDLFNSFQSFFKVCTPESEIGGSSGGSSGTAFFVSNKGHLLTNNHVVDGCEVSKITYQDKDYDTQLIATDKTLDLALLKADLRNKSYLNFSDDEVKKMQKIYVGGYPLGKGLSDDLKISSGIVSSLKGFEDNSNEIQIDAAINPGNSGGPIINEDGELVAIAVSGMSKDKTEGINFGIKASAAERFLKSNDLKASSSFFSSSKDNDELLEILEEATVYTYCN